MLAGLWLHGCVIAAVLRTLNKGFVLDEVSIEQVKKEPLSEKEVKLEVVSEGKEVNEVTQVATSCDSEQGAGDMTGDVAEDTADKADKEEASRQELIPATPATPAAAAAVDTSFSDRLLTEEPRPTTTPVDLVPSRSESMLSVHVSAAADYWDFLRNLNMVLCVFGILLGGFAYFNQLFLFPLYAHELGYSKLDGAALVSFTGVSETITRLLMSGVLDKKWVNKTLLVVVCSLTCSVFGLLLTLHAPRHWYVLLTYALILGAIGGTMIPLAMPILTEYIRMDRISSATGLFLWAMGLAVASGPPILSKCSNT